MSIHGLGYNIYGPLEVNNYKSETSTHKLKCYIDFLEDEIGHLEAMLMNSPSRSKYLEKSLGDTRTLLSNVQARYEQLNK